MIIALIVYIIMAIIAYAAQGGIRKDFVMGGDGTRGDARFASSFFAAIWPITILYVLLSRFFNGR